MLKTTLLSVGFALTLGTQALSQSLNICVEGAYPPFSYTTESGSVAGFDIDIANALCDNLGYDCTLVKTGWDGIIPALLERKCDAIIASMAITPERKQVVDFSMKYYNTPARFVGREGMTMDNLNGAVVGVQRGTVHHEYMRGEHPTVDLKLYGSQDEAFLDLAAGRIDAVMGESIASATGFLETEAGEGFAFFGPPISMPKYHGIGAGIAVRQGEEDLRNAISHAIGELRADGTYQKINQKYFDFDIFGG